MRKSILVVAAHPDDEILGCGGTMARLSSEGFRVHILIMGEGMTSRDGWNAQAKGRSSAILSKLHSQSIKASKLVKAKQVTVLNFPDNRFDTVAILELVKAVEIKKKEVNPHIIFTHHANDLNIDHRLTFQAVMTACRPMKEERVREIYSFEVPSSTEWQSQTSNQTFRPTAYVGLKRKHVYAKLCAMKAYSTEIRSYPHPRSIRALRAYCEWRGSNVGMEFAESFEVVRRII